MWVRKKTSSTMRSASMVGYTSDSSREGGRSCDPGCRYAALRCADARRALRQSGGITG